MRSRPPESNQGNTAARSADNSGLNQKHFNEALAKHQESAQWFFRDQIACLHRWMNRFRATFRLDLAKCLWWRYGLCRAPDTHIIAAFPIGLPWIMKSRSTCIFFREARPSRY